MVGGTSAVLPFKFFFSVEVERYPQKAFAYWQFAPVVVNQHHAINVPPTVEVTHNNGFPLVVVSVVYLCPFAKLVPACLCCSHWYNIPQKCPFVKRVTAKSYPQKSCYWA